jgi:hypothetical protein
MILLGSLNHGKYNRLDIQLRWGISNACGILSDIVECAWLEVSGDEKIILKHGFLNIMAHLYVLCGDIYFCSIVSLCIMNK